MGKEGRGGRRGGGKGKYLPDQCQTASGAPALYYTAYGVRRWEGAWEGAAPPPPAEKKSLFSIIRRCIIQGTKCAVFNDIVRARMITAVVICRARARAYHRASRNA